MIYKFNRNHKIRKWPEIVGIDVGFRTINWKKGTLCDSIKRIGETGEIDVCDTLEMQQKLELFLASSSVVRKIILVQVRVCGQNRPKRAFHYYVSCIAKNYLNLKTFWR